VFLTQSQYTNNWFLLSNQQHSIPWWERRW